MARLTRRRLLAVGGGGAAATMLAACGASEEESERSAAGDAELLQAARTPEADLELTYRLLSRGTQGDEKPVLRELMSALREDSQSRIEELNVLFEEAAGDGARPPASPSQGGVVDLDLTVELLQQAIAAYRQAASLLSTAELREVMLEHVVQVAAELAAVRELLGEEPSPFAFVTGGSAEPYEDTDFDPTADE